MKKLLIIACGLLLLQSCKKSEYIPPQQTPDEVLFADNKVNVVIISSNGDTTIRNTSGKNAGMVVGQFGYGLYIYSESLNANDPVLDLQAGVIWPVGPGTYGLAVDYTIGQDTSGTHYGNYPSIDSTCKVTFTSLEDHYAKGFFSVIARTYSNTDSIKISGEFEGYVK